MEMPLRVMGMRRFKGEIEGTMHDFCKVRLELPVPRKAENEVGANVVEALYGAADRWDELKGIKFPAVCLVDLEPSSKGYDCLSVKPMPASK